MSETRRSSRLKAQPQSEVEATPTATPTSRKRHHRAISNDDTPIPTKRGGARRGAPAKDTTADVTPAKTSRRLTQAKRTRHKSPSIEPVEIIIEPEVQVEVLPCKYNEGDSLPTTKKPQPSDLPNEQYQSIIESGTLIASLKRSREAWLSGSHFHKYYTKIVRKKPKERTEEDNQAIMREKVLLKNMIKLGECTLTIDPHIFDVALWFVREAHPPPQPRPPVQYNSHLPHNSNSQANVSFAPPYNPPKNPGHYTPSTATPTPTHPYARQSPYNASRPPHTPYQSQPSRPSYSAPHPPPARPAATQQSRPSNSNPPPANNQSAPDPVIHMLAQRAGADPKLKAVMKVVAAGKASPDQLRYFQGHIDELTEILNQRQRATAPPSQPKHTVQRQGGSSTPSQPANRPPQPPNGTPVNRPASQPHHPTQQASTVVGGQTAHNQASQQPQPQPHPKPSPHTNPAQPVSQGLAPNKLQTPTTSHQQREQQPQNLPAKVPAPAQSQSQSQAPPKQASVPNTTSAESVPPTPARPPQSLTSPAPPHSIQQNKLSQPAHPTHSTPIPHNQAQPFTSQQHKSSSTPGMPGSATSYRSSAPQPYKQTPTPQTQYRPNPPSQHHPYNTAPPPVRTPYPPTPVQPPKPAFRHVYLEFLEGNGDRLFFPEYAILEYMPGNRQVRFSWLVIHPSSAAPPPSAAPKPPAPPKKITPGGQNVNPATPNSTVKGSPNPAMSTAQGISPAPPPAGQPLNAASVHVSPSPASVTSTPAPVESVAPSTPSAPKAIEDNSTNSTSTKKTPENKAPAASENSIPKSETSTFKTPSGKAGYYQPVTATFYCPNPTVLEHLSRAVKPQEEVRRYMEGVFEKFERAETKFLAFRLPKEEMAAEANGEVKTEASGKENVVPVAEEESKRRKR